MLKKIKYFIFNIINSFFHRATDAEIQLIKNTHLFDNVNKEIFQKIITSIRLIQYPSGKTIIKKKEQGDTLYIIVEGAVRVYNFDLNGQKIPLARLNPGDYFGEQALIGHKHKTRNANVETISDTLLIKIKESAVREFKDVIRVDAVFRRFGFYENLQMIIKNMENPRILEFEDKQTIFNIGDNSDFLYIILGGNVSLLIPDPETGKMNKSLLHEKNLFGELGVIENKQRLGTALAEGKVHLLAINKEELDNYFHKGVALQPILSLLKKSYQIPQKGIVEQFFEYDKETGPQLTTSYHLENGREVVATRALDRNYFHMFISAIQEKDWIRYREGDQWIEINVIDRHLVGIRAKGEWDQLSTLCRMLLDQQQIEEAALELFRFSGVVSQKTSVPEGSKIICDCMSVTKQQIHDCIVKGMTTFAEVSNHTRAGTACGSCKFRVLELLGISSQLAAIMTKQIVHNSYINSYNIKPVDGNFGDYKPGQHVVLQMRIGPNLVERPYTVSKINRETKELQITIKKEPKGYFTQWLFHQAPDNLEITVTHPQGSFIFDMDASTDALCLAGGIGITPFIAFARALMDAKNSKRTHLVYTALTHNDFIFTDEFNSISSAISTFTVNYKATEVEGYLTEEEIFNHVKNLNQPDIYICGPKPYLLLIQNSLKKIDYDPTKVHVEEFVHAGGKQ